MVFLIEIELETLNSRIISEKNIMKKLYANYPEDPYNIVKC